MARDSSISCLHALAGPAGKGVAVLLVALLLVVAPLLARDSCPFLALSAPATLSQLGAGLGGRGRLSVPGVSKERCIVWPARSPPSLVMFRRSRSCTSCCVLCLCLVPSERRRLPSRWASGARVRVVVVGPTTALGVFVGGGGSDLRMHGTRCNAVVDARLSMRVRACVCFGARSVGRCVCACVTCVYWGRGGGGSSSKLRVVSLSSGYRWQRRAGCSRFPMKPRGRVGGCDRDKGPPRSWLSGSWRSAPTGLRRRAVQCDFGLGTAESERALPEGRKQRRGKARVA
jgi:hypothetical protein